MLRRAPLRNAEQLADIRGKPTACSKCHARKVKCTGGQPCSVCIQSGCEADCKYPKRDRQLRVSQNYLEELLAENERLRRNSSRPALPGGDDHSTESGSVEPADGPIHNPVFDDRPWFHDTPGAPLLIGEAADAAFATRFCQALSTGPFDHIQRTSFPSDNTLLSLGVSACPLPSPGKARFLLKAAIKIVCDRHHIVMKSVVLAQLEKFLQQPTGFDVVISSKMWALLALGELYTARSSSGSGESNFPGLAYFAQANRARHVPQERPSLDSIEVHLLLSLYSLNCNRRHSAYTIAGAAVRLGVIMGLNINVPDSQLSDRVMREHRNRVWWTSYEFDGHFAALQSQPASIRDEEILVDLPSDAGLPSENRGDFSDANDMIHRINIIRLTSQITMLLYGRKRQTISFLQRVQQALKDLQDWSQKVEGHPHAGDQQAWKSNSEPMKSLLLALNQCMIVATRPVALYVLRAERDAESANSTTARTPTIPENVHALADACLRCARHSCSVLLDSWLDGSFQTFHYFSTLYLFSAATVLALSSELKGKGSYKDRDDFELASQLMMELKQNGSLAAVELSRHLQAMRARMSNGEEDPTQPSGHRSNVGGLSMGPHMASGSTDSSYPSGGTSWNNGALMSAGMALAEPSMQAFLSQTEPNFQHMDILFLQNGFEGIYWPET